MITIRPSTERGHTNLGWLESAHTFSFSEYHDPAHMGFRALRVINEDRVAPNQGFGTHPHQNMEILSYVLEGSLQHQDSMKNGSVIYPGDVQRMTAGTGVTHSEFNPSPNEKVHFLQIWILPREQGLTPGYEQKTFSSDDKRGRFKLIASPDGGEGSVTIHQDARLYLAELEPRQEITCDISPQRHVWIQVTRGEVCLNGEHLLTAGDGAAISGEPALAFLAKTSSEVMLIDLA